MGAMAVLWSFLGVLKHLLAPPLPMFITIKKNHNSASVFRHPGTPVATPLKYTHAVYILKIFTCIYLYAYHLYSINKSI